MPEEKVYKNPIDPLTGKRKRGRPPKVKPIDTIAGPQPQEKAAQSKPDVYPDIAVDDPDAVVVRALNPKEAVSTELAQEWYRRFTGTDVLDVPDEVKAKYPDGQFCWARNTSECVSKYRTQFGYHVAEVGTPLPGQTDTTFQHGDVILMVRPAWMKSVHDQARRDRLQAQMGNPVVHSDERGAEREALSAAREAGYGSGRRDVSFFTEDETIPPGRIENEIEVTKKAIMHAPGRTRLAGGTKYVFGGIPK